MKNSNETVEYPHVDLLCNGQHYTWRKGETTRCCSLQVFLQFEDRLQKMFSTNWIEPVSGFKGIRKYNTVPPIELNHSLILKGYMSTDWTEPFADSKDIGKQHTLVFWEEISIQHQEYKPTLSILLAWQVINGKVSSEKVLQTQERPLGGGWVSKFKLVSLTSWSSISRWTSFAKVLKKNIKWNMRFVATFVRFGANTCDLYLTAKSWFLLLKNSSQTKVPILLFPDFKISLVRLVWFMRSVGW